MRKQNLFFIIRINLISILLGLFTTQSFAQNITITGTVKDQSGEPLIGVNVMEKGTTNGSITDMDGKYSVSSTGKKQSLYSLILDTYPKRFLLATGKQSM